eukprot:SAG31_NODE_93_length_26250_cov_47.615082_17_plen_90_part_00
MVLRLRTGPVPYGVGVVTGMRASCGVVGTLAPRPTENGVAGRLALPLAGGVVRRLAGWLTCIAAPGLLHRDDGNKLRHLGCCTSTFFHR